MRERYPSGWKAIEWIAAEIGCAPTTLPSRVKRAEMDSGQCLGITTEERERIGALGREKRELRRANEFLKTVSAFFARAEPGCQLKK